ncbi:hypothetical protein ACIGBN_15755 [Marinomonas sp. NPDC078689]|uniref:hypothetical protein n=1 Tax=Marinomonas sp. NPDC078689 TaxID=3364147 RepID=UPI0037CA5F11
MPRKSYAKGLKEIFWLLFYQLKKVTRSAELNKSRENKALEWNPSDQTNNPILALYLSFGRKREETVQASSIMLGGLRQVSR